MHHKEGGRYEVLWGIEGSGDLRRGENTPHGQRSNSGAQRNLVPCMGGQNELSVEKESKGEGGKPRLHEQKVEPPPAALGRGATGHASDCSGPSHSRMEPPMCARTERKNKSSEEKEKNLESKRKSETPGYHKSKHQRPVRRIQNGGHLKGKKQPPFPFRRKIVQAGREKV